MTCWRDSSVRPPRQRLSGSTRTSKGLRWPDPNLIADAEFVHFVETRLAGAIGASSARIMIASAVREEALTLDEMRRIIAEASQLVLYSHMLEQKSSELEAATAELRAANERLTELDRLKDEFISTVTHELRTPLTSIRAFSEILRADPNIELAQRRKFVDIIAKETERLTRLINQVLDLAKIESGQVEWELSRVDMNEVVSDSVAAMSQVFKEKGIEVTVNAPQQVPAVRADLDRMVQVLLNLLSNAAKFCEAGGGRIEIRVSSGENFVQVDVRDNGPGLSADEQKVIFDKFRQAGDTLTGKPQGTGLGLYISRHIVEHFGGRLWVESRPGEGACFSLSLPVRHGREGDGRH